MDVITTHINADFDSLGAMVGARKLYPDAILAFSGSQEKTLRQFLVESSLHALDLQRAKQVDLEQVSRLILVDVAQAERIGRFAEVVGKPGVEVHLYDHHPPTPRDVQAHVRHVDLVGAATTLLVELIRERRIPLERDEATLMALGIFEDTGGFTFSTTTPRDLEAAAYLLSQGADLGLATECLTPELTVEQVSLLDELLKNRASHLVHGVEVTLCEGSRDQYVGDLAVLAHKIRDMENLDVLVLLVRMEDRVQIVARSRLAEVDVAKLARAFGGGGHPEAASATVRDLTLIQVRERILGLLPQVVRPRTIVRDIWTTPVKTLEAGTSLADAFRQLDRYHINAMPVVREGRPVGIVTRLLLGRALQHGLTHVPVEEYMLTEFAVVGPEAPLEEVREHIIRGNQRFLPVVDAGGRLLGAVTRTDLLRALEGPELGEALSTPTDVQERHAAKLMEERLDPELLESLRALGRRAAEMGMHAYLVGGGVRDVLLRRDTQDIDVVVEGDGIALAQAFAAECGGTAHPHRVFGTAKVLCPGGVKFDVATARTEYYKEPAALPAVEWSSLKLDLYRRDFTINTLALRLDPERFGEVLDFFGGLRDLKEGTIRILHNLSFVEDPTRVLRALRFKIRFGFRLGKQTQRLLRSAVQMGFLAQARGHRLFHEWVQLLQEGDPVEALEELEEHEVLRGFHPKLRLEGKARELVGRVRGVVTWFQLLYLDTPIRTWMVYLLALLDPLADQDVEELVAAFGIGEREGRVLLDARSRSRDALLRLREELWRGAPKNSRVYEILHACDPETLLFLMAKTRDDQKRRLISRYYTHLSAIRPSLRGRDLKALGIPPGPVYRQLLADLLRARLDGEVKTRDDEVKWVLERWREREQARDAPAAS
ncbi:MAG: CBS domain-containing protein [Deferrisomatales bacterium]